MHPLVKKAHLFLTLAQGSRMEAVKEEKRQQIREALQNYNPPIVIRLVKDFYHLIKQDPQLLDDVAQYFVKYLYNLDKLPFITTQKELCDKIFIIALANTDDFTMPIKIIKWWGSFLDPNLIREFTRRLLQWLKDTPEDEQWIVLNTLQNIVNNDKIRPYINTTLFERVLSIHSPHRLPMFDPTKAKLNSTDILAMLKGHRHSDKMDSLMYPDLLKIINKSTPQAQELLRSLLWQEYGGQMYTTRKFRLDQENKPVDIEGRPIELYGRLAPANTTSFNQYDTKEQEERKQWHQSFTDFNVVPFIEF